MRVGSTQRKGLRRSMSPVASKTDHTPEDLLTMPEGERYELVNGKLVERSMSLWSSYVAGRVYGLLHDYLRGHPLGWLLPEGTSYQCFPHEPLMVRRPDVSFIVLQRLSAT